MLPKDIFITLFLELIKVFAVARNGQPNMTRICLHSSTIALIFKTKQIHKIYEFSTRIIPFGTLIDLSTSKRVVKIGFNSPRLSFQYNE